MLTLQNDKSNKYMERQNINIINTARQLGLLLGIFYMIRFICIPLSVNYPGLSVIYALMFVAAPFLYGYITMIVREKLLKGVLSFGNGFRFLFNMIICGTLIEAATHFIYFRFFDNGMLAKWYMANITEFENQFGQDAMVEQMKTYVDSMSSISAIDITISMFASNVLWAVVFSVLIAAILRKSPSNL